MWAKIIAIKRTKDLNYFSLCVLNLIQEFHNLSWITEINELFHNILIYWDAAICIVILIFMGDPTTTTTDDNNNNDQLFKLNIN